MFTVAIGLLSVVTLGVTYLAVLSFFDSRQEKKDQDTGPTRSLAEQRQDQKLKEAEAAAEKKRTRKVVDKSKGFGN
ncbi:MAG: hypothetical protein J3K34DRAFT_423092 [Monoraphidium minutum]|nr:MAG: hypothetical protein J3K34DRAFT_423092 [Monoraphidium minutum]